VGLIAWVLFWGGILHPFSGRVLGLRAHARLTKMQLEHLLPACKWFTQSPFLERFECILPARGVTGEM
jgi:hypothetical protein